MGGGRAVGGDEREGARLCFFFFEQKGRGSAGGEAASSLDPVGGMGPLGRRR